MASNDMNSWDDNPDELLRRHWQKAFDDFEVQPRSSLSQRILNQLSAGRHRRPVRWLAGGLLLLLSVGLFYQVQFSERIVRSGKITTAPPVTARYSGPNSGSSQPATAAVRPVSPEPAQVDVRSNENITHQRTTIQRSPAYPTETSDVPARQMKNPQVETLAGLRTEANELSRRTTMGAQRTIGKARLRTEVESSLHATSATRQSLSKPPRSTSSRFSAKPSGQNPDQRFGPVQELRGESTNQPTLPAPPAMVSYAPANFFRSLRLSGRFQLPSHLSGLPNQLPAFDLGTQPLVERVVAHPAQRWFIDVAPLSSFQWMSALPASVGYLSQVHSPAAFSPATWGYQLNGGIRFQRWQAHLSIGQLRRWAYYTVNENRYRVEPNPANPYHLVREAYTVAENVALPMIGAGLSQYRVLNQGRYVAELGGQVSYLPTIRQTLLGLRGGISRRLSLNHRMELQAGLTIEYGLNRLLSEQRQLAIHPVVVGFGVRIQPRLEKP